MDGKKQAKAIKTSVKMSDVAAAAGVSRVTVSRVLSNKDFVLQSKRDAVMAAVASLGYNRNVNAGILAGNRSRTVGLVVSNLGNPRTGEIVGEFSRFLDAENFQLVVIQYKPLEDLGKYLVSFSERRVDAVVLLGIGLQKEFLEDFKIFCPIIISDLFSYPPKKLAKDLTNQMLKTVFGV